MAQLQKEAQRQNFTSSAWIGLYSDSNSWHWSLGYEPLGDMKVWDVGEPNNNGGKQDCFLIRLSGWMDYSCSGAFPFLCFDGKVYSIYCIIHFPIVSVENVAF